jgi:hypothetical protein
VQPAELVARLLHHCQTVLKFRDRAMVWSCIAARRLDLIDDFLRGCLVRALAAAAGARIVHHNLGAMRSHQLGDLGSDAASRSRANCDPAFQHAHPQILFRQFIARLSRGAWFLSIKRAAIGHNCRRG